MKIISTSVIFLLFYALSSIYAQVDDITWQKCFGTENNDKIFAAAEYNNGYIFGMGISTDGPGITNFHYSPDGMADAWIIHTDSLGNIIWERCYGGSDGDTPHKIIPLSNNDIYLINSSGSTDGDVKSFNYGYGDFWIVKIDNTGSIIWEKCYGSPNTDEVRDAILTPDGGLVVLGRVTTEGGNVSQYYGMRDVWIFKIDSLGQLQWEKTIGNQGNDNALKIGLTSDTTYFVVAGLNESGGMAECEHMGPWDGLDIWLLEMDLNGNILRQLCYGGSGNDLGRNIIKVDGGYVFISDTDSNDGDVSGLHGAYDIWVVRIDTAGSIIWQKCLGGTSYEWADHIFENDDGGFTIIGHTQSHNGDVSNNHSLQGANRYDIWAIKLSSEGELEWEHCFGGIASEQFWGIHAVIKENDSQFIIAAVAESESIDVECDLYGFPDQDAWVFEIKDCSLYVPEMPELPTGPDTLCITTDSVSIYNIPTANGAWSYEWQVYPSETGDIIGDSTHATLYWAQGWEGLAEISVRSWNSCGYSNWSTVHNTWAYSCLEVGDIQQIKAAFILFPNPAQSEIKCKSSSVHHQSFMIIYDIYGVRLQELEIPKGHQVIQIDISSYPAGIYIAVLKSEREILGRKKFVVR